MAYVKVFFCYAREDEVLKDELDKHLISMKRQGLITIWHEREVLAGSDWTQELQAQLDEAHLFLLLISSDFLNSDFCFSMMRDILQRNAEGEVEIIPILLRPVDGIHHLFRTGSILPTNGTPITSWPNRDEAFSEVAKEIRNITIEYLTENIVHTSATLGVEEPAGLTASIANLYLSMGNRYYNDEKYQEALHAYEQTISLYPVSSNQQAFYLYHNYPIAFKLKGKTLNHLKRYEEALAAFEQVIHLEPSAKAYNDKGLTLYNLERYEEALSAFEQAIRVNPNFVYAYNNKGHVLLYNLERYEEALSAFEQAIRVNPNFVYAYNNKGHVLLYNLERYEEALAAFEQAIRLDPNQATAYKNMSYAFLHLKRYQEAKQAREKAHQLRYSD